MSDKKKITLPQQSVGSMSHAVKPLFSHDPFSTENLGKVHWLLSAILIVVVALIAATGKTLFLEGLIGRLIASQGNILAVIGKSLLSFVATGISFLIMPAVMLGLLLLLFAIKKVSSPFSAHLFLAALTSVVLLAISVMMSLLWRVPWDSMGYAFIGLMLYRYYTDNIPKSGIPEAFLTVAVWVSVFVLAARPLMFAFK
jgi:hypothetical protein